MGTRSNIIVHRKDGKWHRIYCHWDGYLSHNGQILFDHYKTRAKAENLVKYGDLSSLGEIIGKRHPFESPPMLMEVDKPNPAYEEYKKKYGRMCKFYGRDRKDPNTAGTVVDTLADAWPPSDTWTEFVYVWDHGQWFVGDPDKGPDSLIDLDHALSGEKVIQPAIKAFGSVIGQHAPHDPQETI